MKYKYRTEKTLEAFRDFQQQLALTFSWWRVSCLKRTQAQIVRESKVSRSVVSDIETASRKRSTTLELLVAIADTYDYELVIDFKKKKNNLRTQELEREINIQMVKH